ncbi:MAG: hypothetical protein HYT22_03140 [Candidatus Niyogibacteria bacterium]|nr:hypothetical protein [Candidatus Niyogibacteria bacterium]
MGRILASSRAEKEALFIELGDELFAEYAKDGEMPPDMFHWMCRTLVTTAYELFVLDIRRLEILLIRRPADDPEWPNQLHSPGTVILPGETFETARDRLIAREIRIGLSAPIFVKAHRFPKSNIHPRDEVNLQHVAVAHSQPSHGAFYSLDDLPESEMVSHHVVMAKFLRRWLHVHSPALF